MSIRINRVYTRTGDAGETSLVGGERVPKDSPRIEAFGCLDELNACLGLVRTCIEALVDAGPELRSLDAEFSWIQNKLFDLGAHLATPPGKLVEGMPSAGPGDVEHLEQLMDAFQADLPELKSFVLPGGGELGARLHLARTVSRRAEILALRVHREEPLAGPVLAYLNRLSDFLFVAARHASRISGIPETLWQPSPPKASSREESE